MRKITWYLFFLVIAVVYATQYFFRSASVGEKKEPDTVSYNFHIRPILSDKCFACHGPDGNKREAELRLDIPEIAFSALKDNPTAHALVVGDPMHSEVYLRIISDDSTEKMPPPASNLALSSYEIALIKKWISQGAKYEKHWAFDPLKEPSLPLLNDEKDWPKNEIDYFVLIMMQREGLHPNPEADKERLLKRVSLDLNGL
ncbi:MAG: c-type cytochrome domain-containing protein, partial [Flavitalea sp.]